MTRSLTFLFSSFDFGFCREIDLLGGMVELAELHGAGWESALVAALLTWRWGDLGSSPGDEILDFSLLFF